MFVTLADTVPFRGGLIYTVAVNSAKAATAQLQRESQQNQQITPLPPTTAPVVIPSPVGPANRVK